MLKCCKAYKSRVTGIANGLLQGGRGGGGEIRPIANSRNTDNWAHIMLCGYISYQILPRIKMDF